MRTKNELIQLLIQHRAALQERFFGANGFVFMIVILQELRPVTLPSGVDARLADSPTQAMDKSVAAPPR
jgi:hypothetical protein